MINKQKNAISVDTWRNSTRSDYSTLHQIAPYIGKMKPIMAQELILNFTERNDIILDPFVGSGTTALEAIIEGRNIICGDINPYAYTLTMAKLAPPKGMEAAREKASKYLNLIDVTSQNINTKNIPIWVKNFFHPKTLVEILSFAHLLRKNNEHFLMACLLGILHHQRPGFLSFPASNLVPYLRTNKYPKNEFPKMYEYRDINSRIMAKIERTYKRFPKIDEALTKKCYLQSATDFKNHRGKIDAIITSPPYMNNLDYARDNRLRLYFLGVDDYRPLDEGVKNNILFSDLITRTFLGLKPKLKKGGKLIIVLGNKNKNSNVVEIVENDIFNKINGFNLISKFDDDIPDIRRSRRNLKGTKKEWILVFEKTF